MRILVVDDDPDIRRLQARLLTRWGYEVEAFEDGAACLERLATGDVDLVISDWLMPNLTGPELCRQIRATAFDHYIYVILCTAKNTSSDLVVGMEAGADDFITKPVQSEELRVRLRAAERMLRLERGLAERNRELEATNARLETARQRIESDLEAAAAMQASLLPPKALAAFGVRSEWLFRPSHYVAGDIFNFFPMEDRYVGFYILDVAGHGVPAAMLSVTLSMVLQQEVNSVSPFNKHTSENDTHRVTPPAEVITHLNRRFQMNNDQYFTMIYGFFDVVTSHLHLSQAGHPVPILISRSGEVRRLGDGGFPVGILPNSKYEESTFDVSPGDRLILFSDGVSECRNAQGEFFGESRIIEDLKLSSSLSLAEMLAALEKDVDTWADGQFDDDLSVLAIDLIPSESD